MSKTADIKQIFEIIDKASAPLKTIAANSQQALKGFQKLKNISFDGLKSKIQDLGTALSGSFLNSTLVKIAAIVAGLLSVKKALELVKKAVNISDDISLLEVRLKNVGVSLSIISEAAKRSRTDLKNMADFVARIGFNAGSMFANQGELLKFSETLSKQFKLSGATSEEIESATVQLSQALGAGVLRGQEFASVLRSAPAAIQAIAKYLNVPRENLKKLADQGLITADIVKKAIIQAADDIDEKFKKIPKTFSDILTDAKNKILISFKPIADKISEIINSEDFQKIIDNITDGLSLALQLATPLLEAFKSSLPTIANGLETVAQNIDKIGVALITAAASLGFAIAACSGPIGWTIAVIALLIYDITLIAEVADTTGARAENCFATMVGGIARAAGIITNIAVGIANSFLTAFNMIKIAANGLDIALSATFGGILKLASKAAEGVANLFIDAWNKVKELWGGKQTAHVKLSWGKNLLNHAEDTYSKVQDLADNLLKWDNPKYYLQFADVQKWRDSAVNWANNLGKKAAKTGGDNGGGGNFFGKTFTSTGDSLSGIGKNTGRTAKNTASIDKNISDMNESLNILKELSMRTIFARSTPININVQMTNNQTFPESFSPTGVAKQTNDELMRIMSQELNQIRAISGIQVGF